MMTPPLGRLESLYIGKADFDRDCDYYAKVLGGVRRPYRKCSDAGSAAAVDRSSRSRESASEKPARRRLFAKTRFPLAMESSHETFRIPSCLARSPRHSG